MTEGLYTAASGMLAQTRNLEAIAGNLANLSTPGYKRDIPVFTSQLQDMLEDPLWFQTTHPEPTTQEIVEPDIAIDLTDGPLRRTDNPCDLALQGPGFLVVQTDEGEAYTRSGALSLDSAGNLVTHSGRQILGEGGPINVTGNTWGISPRGEVTVDGAITEQLQLVEIPAASLQRIGDGLMLSDTAPEPLDWTETQVKQGFLEQSNANVMWEMVSLIAAMRTYEANQKMLQVEDQTLGTAVNDVGQV
ncbi:MAG: flagellar hook-basal body complex protein [Armatimonadetes bacterium]|nr:flagellar hook-basal body complex protein [Armatimonadota bacterium]NIM24365.1 flagellar hook-basal body complex protein [Armatimonadota bacterium]NIM68234.1 flagellar hook-basal body complex protein [Armatimonadota bacterium]NIM75135.1 flagellar hook-basal body complex protein [Armatimonadota bacterium]NIN06439.1 flagellar hook-basal body complex protein [Armatimonadota bacterium]